jgi:hypothetical protein
VVPVRAPRVGQARGLGDAADAPTSVGLRALPDHWALVVVPISTYLQPFRIRLQGRPASWHRGLATSPTPGAPPRSQPKPPSAGWSGASRSTSADKSPWAPPLESRGYALAETHVKSPLACRSGLWIWRSRSTPRRGRICKRTGIEGESRAVEVCPARSRAAFAGTLDLRCSSAPPAARAPRPRSARGRGGSAKRTRARGASDYDPVVPLRATP